MSMEGTSVLNSILMSELTSSPNGLAGDFRNSWKKVLSLYW